MDHQIKVYLTKEILEACIETKKAHQIPWLEPFATDISQGKYTAKDVQRIYTLLNRLNQLRQRGEKKGSQYQTTELGKEVLAKMRANE